MGIFTEDKGTFLFLLCVLFHPFDPGIHGAVYIGIGPQFSPFVMNRSGIVTLMNPLVAGRKIDAVSCFISHRPDDDGRVVFVPLHHASYAIEVRFFPGGIFSKTFFTITHSVRFNVGFINNVNPKFVTQVIPPGIIRIMTGPDGIDVILLE